MKFALYSLAIIFGCLFTGGLAFAEIQIDFPSCFADGPSESGIAINHLTRQCSDYYGPGGFKLEPSNTFIPFGWQKYNLIACNRRPDVLPGNYDCKSSTENCCREMGFSYHPLPDVVGYTAMGLLFIAMLATWALNLLGIVGLFGILVLRLKHKSTRKILPAFLVVWILQVSIDIFMWWFW
jgi:hypothetical protein